GEQVEALERERSRIERERDERARRRTQIEQACRQLGTALPDSAMGYAEQVERARGLLSGNREQAGSVDEAIAERMAERREDER
ncbi:hypothetical protein, partial [Paraburkholderia sp. SIMBA_053]|uniref:hypothetical protein n=1 Tax=Paraburkholderia sp. SIMBA_053 TaxID=3085794 RepID=UPI00397A42E4